MVALRPQPRLTQPPPSGQLRRRLILCGAACLLGWQLAQRSDGEAFVGASQAAEARKASPSCVCRGAAKEASGAATDEKEDPFERLQKALNKGKAATPEPVSEVKPAEGPRAAKREAPAADADECDECAPDFDDESVEDARAAKKEVPEEDPFEKVAKVLPALPKPGKILSPDQLESVARELDGSVSLKEMRLIAVLKESRINKDGSSEAEAFLKYFPGGEVFVDEERGFYKALGQRSFWAILNGKGLSFIRQRLSGISAKKVRGNFNGAFGFGTDSLLLGGSFLITPSGRVVWTHKEGDGPIPLDELKDKLRAFASDEGEKTTPQNDWLQQVFDIFR